MLNKHKTSKQATILDLKMHRNFIREQVEMNEATFRHIAGPGGGGRNGC